MSVDLGNIVGQTTLYGVGFVFSCFLAEIGIYWFQRIVFGAVIHDE